MLQSIHDKAKGILGIIIVIFLGLVFALWGIGDYLTGATEKFAARVDGMDISQTELEQGITRQRQRLEQMFQGQVPDSPVFQQRIKEQVLEQLITQRVLKKMVADEGYQVADQVLADKIKSMEAFQQNGAFAVDAYTASVQSQGMAVKEFENLYRSDLAIQQLQDAITRSAFVGKAELEVINQIQQQSREINYWLFSKADFLASIDVSEDEIKDYYDRNQTRFMHPETMSVSYVEIKADELAEDIPVDEAAVKRLYDEYVASLQLKEQRQARHILISVSADADADTQQQKKTEIENLLARINKGESFEDLAKEKSEDPGSAAKGGDLGWVSRGMMLPEFETVLYRLKKGQVSDVVKTDYGYHIIRFDEVKAPAIASFEAKQAELIRQFRAQQVDDKFYEKSERMATMAYENDQSLQEVSDVLGLKINTTPTFTRQQGAGIAVNEKVRQAAFDPAVLSEGRNSEIIEIEKNHALVLRIHSHTAATAKELSVVKPQIISALKAEKASEKTKAAALEALAQLEKTPATESKPLVTEAKLTKLGSVKRDNNTANPQIISAAFALSRPVDNKPVYKLVEMASGAAIVELTAVTSPPPATEEQLQALAQKYQSEQANNDMAAVLESLKAKSKIVRAKDL